MHTWASKDRDGSKGQSKSFPASSAGGSASYEKRICARELCTSPQDGSACLVIDTASHGTFSGGWTGWGSTNTLPQCLWDDIFAPHHHTCCYGAQTCIGNTVQASLQIDLMQSKSSSLLPPWAFVLHFLCNYMLNICLSICWIPSICMTRFNAGLAKPNGMTAMPSNHRPSAAGSLPSSARSKRGGKRENTVPPPSCYAGTPSSYRKKNAAFFLGVGPLWKNRQWMPYRACYLALSKAQHLSWVLCHQVWTCVALPTFYWALLASSSWKLDLSVFALMPHYGCFSHAHQGTAKVEKKLSPSLFLTSCSKQLVRSLEMTKSIILC